MPRSFLQGNGQCQEMKNTGRQKTRSPLLHFIFRVMRAAVLIYLGLLLLLAGFQRRLIYFPAKGTEEALRARAVERAMLPWEDAHGQLIGWRQPPRNGLPPQNRIVIFHGNAGFALHRAYFRDTFRQVDGERTWEVYLFEYPGFGARPGSPSARIFARTAREAVEELSRTDHRPIYLLGESIGTGVASHLAGELPNQIAGVILITPFNTLAEVAAHHFPLFPVRLILRERYDNRAALSHYTGPVAFLLAGKDEVIPARFGHSLYQSYAGPKQLWIQENATHNTIDYDPSSRWWREISDFLVQTPEQSGH
jgi:uncharacterized protein